MMQNQSQCHLWRLSRGYATLPLYPSPCIGIGFSILALHVLMQLRRIGCKIASGSGKAEKTIMIRSSLGGQNAPFICGNVRVGNQHRKSLEHMASQLANTAICIPDGSSCFHILDLMEILSVDGDLPEPALVKVLCSSSMWCASAIGMLCICPLAMCEKAPTPLGP